MKTRKESKKNKAPSWKSNFISSEREVHFVMSCLLPCCFISISGTNTDSSIMSGDLHTFILDTANLQQICLTFLGKTETILHFICFRKIRLCQRKRKSEFTGFKSIGGLLIKELTNTKSDWSPTRILKKKKKSYL